MLRILAALCLCLFATNQAHSEDGFWVIVGVTQSSLYDDAGAKRVHARIQRCGFEAFNDFTDKFTGFTPKMVVFVLGPYQSRAEANAVLSKARACVPDAYVKHSRYLGE